MTIRTVSDLNNLVKHPPRPKAPRPSVSPAGPTGSIGGRGVAVPPPQGGVSAGIASPLTEPNYARRGYHPAVVLTSSDGAFTIEVQPLAHIELEDALGLPVEIEFAAPP